MMMMTILMIDDDDMCVLGTVELAAEFQAVLDKCPSSMAKRWLVLRVCCPVCASCFTQLCDIVLCTVCLHTVDVRKQVGCIRYVFVAILSQAYRSVDWTGL